MRFFGFVIELFFSFVLLFFEKITNAKPQLPYLFYVLLKTRCECTDDIKQTEISATSSSVRWAVAKAEVLSIAHVSGMVSCS